MNKYQMRDLARHYRAKGLSYSQIARELQTPLPLTTIEEWCRGVEAPMKFEERQEYQQKEQLRQSQLLALDVESNDPKVFIEQLANENREVSKSIEHSSSKVLLAMLWVGGRTSLAESYVSFTTASPDIMRLFMVLFRSAYELDERKLRCVVECRFGQDSEKLMREWSTITEIPVAHFYKPHMDRSPRRQLKTEPPPHGSCVVSYLSQRTYFDLVTIVSLVAAKMSGTSIDIASFLPENK